MERSIVTSLQVAEHFRKNHKDVLRDIRVTIEKCSHEFNERNFAPVEYTDAKGEKRPMYILSKDGFMMVAMGYTGAEAMRMKKAYIARFNEMEKALQANAPTSDGFTLLPWHGAADTLRERRASHDEVHTNGGGLCRRHLFGYGLAERLEPRRMASKGMGHGGGCSCGCDGGYGSVAMVAGEAVKRIPTPENSGVPRDALSWVGGLCSVCGVGYASRKGGNPMKHFLRDVAALALADVIAAVVVHLLNL
ncbi:Rha family transcriptional regulator [Bilophila wadsworthia]|uniref:Rha family transcriptional regulator n=1 Tax=Bilophila wadsworthia TaxID=35833 RepID=UPI002432476D|nr:Rha family transcriptional regulator [Bilophila wadsworthia]